MLIENTYIYEVKSIGLSERKGRKPQTLMVAARHNLREIQAENGADFGTIDPTRMHLNEVLIGPKSAREVLCNSNKLFAEIGVDPSRLRKDYNQASEHVFSLKPGQCEGNFFQVIAEASKQIFGDDKVLSFVVHRDQDQPHAHMLVSPIAAGEYHGSKLHDHEQLKRIKAEYKKWAETIGFTPVPERRVKRKKLKEMVASIIVYLEHVNDPLLLHPMWPMIFEMISKDPLPLYLRLGLDKASVPKTMSQERLFGGNNFSIRSSDRVIGSENYQNLPCVGFGCPGALSNVDNSDQLEVEVERVTRVRINELAPQNYDCETGEFYKPVISTRNGKSDADNWVSNALSNLYGSSDKN